MAKIKKITAREILDSRGVPTIEGRLILDDEKEVTAIASSGESKGKYERVELRDQDQERYNGLGVKKAISYINNLIGPKLIGVSPEKQADIDYWLMLADGSENSSQLGVNVLMTVSQLVFKAAAVQKNLPLYKYFNFLYNDFFKKNLPIEKIPAPIFCLINGGKHGTKNLEFQEFQIIPSTSFSFSSSLQLGVEIYHSLKEVLDYRNAGTTVSEEGGFAPNLLTNIDGLEIIKETLLQEKKQLGVDIFLGLDLAASHYYKNGKYTIKDRPSPLSINEYIEYLINLNKEYSLLLLEDPIEEEDFESWKKINDKLGNNTYLVGDDFVAGNKKRLLRAINEKAASVIVIKFNSVSTISEMLEFINLCKEANLKIIFSQRMGETNDSIIADFAMAIQADFVKFGAPVRGERVAKYNRLLEIEEEINRN